MRSLAANLAARCAIALAGVAVLIAAHVLIYAPGSSLIPALWKDTNGEGGGQLWPFLTLYFPAVLFSIVLHVRPRRFGWFDWIVPGAASAAITVGLLPVYAWFQPQLHRCWYPPPGIDRQVFFWQMSFVTCLIALAAAYMAVHFRVIVELPSTRENAAWKARLRRRAAKGRPGRAAEALPQRRDDE